MTSTPEVPLPELPEITEDDRFTIECAVENMRLADPSEAQIDARWRLAYRLSEIVTKLRAREAYALAALAARPGEFVAVARVDSVDEYGPCLSWNELWTDHVGATLYVKRNPA